MREKIYFLAKGMFTYEPPEPVIEPEKIETQVSAGTKAQVTITVSNKRETKLKGFGFCAAQEITFLPVFEGEKNILECEIDATELIAGTHLQGKLVLVTDCGETSVPYDIDITAPVLKDEEGMEVRDYFTLEKIAASAPKEGLKLFRDPAFLDTFLYRDPEGQLVYERLMKGNTGLLGMEEFLVAFEKKQSVRFMPEHTGGMTDGVLEYELEGSDIEDVIMVNLSTWGSIALRIDVEGEFIKTDRKILWTDEFPDRRGRLEFSIISGLVSPGWHTGRIIITGPYESHSVEIRVHSPVGSKERKVRRAKQAVEAMLVRSILAYEEGRVDKAELNSFLQKHRSVLEKLELRYQKPLMGYMAYLTSSEAGKLEFYRDTELLDAPEVRSEQALVENYILIEYIKYLYSQREDDADNLRQMVALYAGNGYMGPVLLMIGMRLGMEAYSTDAKCVEGIRGHLAQGGNSPVMYSELIKRFLADPSLLHELDALNLRTILYGLRQGLISRELSDVITVLSAGRGLPPIESGVSYGYIRDDDPLGRGTGALLMQVLFKLYDIYPSDDLLKSICTLLIRYEKRDGRYFPWYEKGVEKMLRLTDLFEYYMYTVSPTLDQPLPSSVLSYFQFENHLGDPRKAFLYANIVRFRDDQPQVYENYKEQIREFTIAQLQRERVTKDLGYLYSSVITEEDMEDENYELAEHLPHIMFRHLIICETPGIESVTIIHMQAMTERTYPLDRGKALLDIYTPDYRLFFSDRDGNQYVESIEYSIERFFDGDRFAPYCYPVAPGTGIRYAGAIDNAEDVPDAESGIGKVLEAAAGEESKPRVEIVPAEVPENLLFYLAVQTERHPGLDDMGLDVLFRALDCGKLRDAFHRKVFLKLFDHIKERVGSDHRSAYMRLLIRYLRPHTIRGRRIGEIAAACVNCGSYDDAFLLLRRFGGERCADDEMTELVIHRIRETEYEFDDCLVKWALMLYRRGHREHPILNYLLQYYMGETDTLISIFRDSIKMNRSAKGTAQLESFEGHIKSNPAFYESVRERLLGQVIFACRDLSETVDVFLKYYDDGENRVLVKAYLSQLAYEYVVGRIEIDDPVYEKIFRQAGYEKETVMVLAAMKKLSKQSVYNEKEREFISDKLYDLAAEGIVLPFMKDFAGKLEVPYEIRTPVIVQYYSSTPKGVFFFYKNRSGEYESHPMNKVFDGIYTAAVLLFADETTTGYIYEEETGKHSKEFELKKKETISGNGSMFEQVNAMQQAKSAGDEKKYERLAKEFIREQQLAKALFKLM